MGHDSFKCDSHTNKSKIWRCILRYDWFIWNVTPVAGSNLLPEKVSNSPNFFSEIFFPNSVTLCSFLGLRSGFINPPLQSLVTQHVSQIFQRLFSKKKSERKSPRGSGVVKCREFESKNLLKWVVPISQKYQVYFEITWKSSNSEEVRKSSGNRRLFPGQIWSCDRRDSFVWDMTHPRETGRRNMFMIKMIAHDSVKNDFAHDLSKMILHMTYQKWCRTWLIDIISLSQQNDLAHDSVEKRSCTWLIDIISPSHQNDLAHDSSKMILHMTYWHRFTESTK